MSETDRPETLAEFKKQTQVIFVKLALALSLGMKEMLEEAGDELKEILKIKEGDEDIKLDGSGSTEEPRWARWEHEGGVDYVRIKDNYNGEPLIEIMDHDEEEIPYFAFQFMSDGTVEHARGIHSGVKASLSPLGGLLIDSVDYSLSTSQETGTDQTPPDQERFILKTNDGQEVELELFNGSSGRVGLRIKDNLTGNICYIARDGKLRLNSYIRGKGAQALSLDHQNRITLSAS